MKDLNNYTNPSGTKLEKSAMHHLSREQLKRIRSLKQKKQRLAQQRYVVEGSKLVDEVIGAAAEIELIVATEEWKGLDNAPENTFLVKQRQMDQLTGFNAASPVMAVLPLKENKLDQALLSEGITILLDDIRDPGNLGSIIRSAEWFGITQVICSENSADLYNPKTLQSTMGSFLRIPCVNALLPAICSELKNQGIKIIGADVSGENLFESGIEKPVAVIIGNESNGIHKELLDLCDTIVSIPGGDGGMDSLNAAVSASIIMADLTKFTV